MRRVINCRNFTILFKIRITFFDTESPYDYDSSQCKGPL